ncbi:hypothetical protein, unlikely [Trypanosoma brucei brucei TREU927]|uniref:Uncharacterized protein n=1 Tax=Trypanosoma brucei brucei (strain 927/4 GUTat10.1) TaxID=185431 RepID=Q4GY62_TRYB2|nr:hypothetical protein, unlikely [Trypanosoma brucei brucei TREU927]CAJ16725.1 hypothetical protein, unlikely [Trypanosoma brucei brucei TREU927]
MSSDTMPFKLVEPFVLFHTIFSDDFQHPQVAMITQACGSHSTASNQSTSHFLQIFFDFPLHVEPNEAPTDLIFLCKWGTSHSSHTPPHGNDVNVTRTNFLFRQCSQKKSATDY